MFLCTLCVRDGGITRIRDPFPRRELKFFAPLETIKNITTSGLEFYEIFEKCGHRDVSFSCVVSGVFSVRRKCVIPRYT